MRRARHDLKRGFAHMPRPGFSPQDGNGADAEALRAGQAVRILTRHAANARRLHTAATALHEGLLDRSNIRTRRSNAVKSVIRSGVEHVFANQKSRMGLFVRTVGIQRAEMKIGLANLVYNIGRFLYLERIDAA